MRLECDGEFIRAIYQAADSSWNMLLLDKTNRSWFYDTYGDGGLTVIRHDRGQELYRLVGFTVNGNFVRQTAGQDVSTPVQARWRTSAFDGGDTRAEKRWGDFSLDIEGAGQSITVVPYFENFTLPEPSQLVNNPTRAI